MAEVLDDLLLQSFDLLVCILPLRHDDRVGNGHFFEVAGLNVSTKSSAASNNMETLVGLEEFSSSLPRKFKILSIQND